MNNPSYQGESYYLCSKCGLVDHNYNIGNTFQIDKTFDFKK
jgi:hypothetical protein